MKKLIYTSLIAVLCWSWTSLEAQVRYEDEIFANVQVTENVIYGNNISVLPPAGPLDLLMDVYQPQGDTASKRPVVAIATTGNFLPAIVNGGPYGSLKDSAIVEMCTRFAKRGFVAISFFYRKGWDPLNPIQEIQTATLLQAAYKGIIDARTLARFLRKSVAENNNPYGIDPGKMVIGGTGTGGYVSLGTAYLSEFEEVKLPKFTDFMTGQPYVDTTVHGNILGTNTTMQNLPNHLGYASDYHMAFNLGGALGDSSWIDAGEIPSVNFHVPTDPNAPYDIGIVIVPTTGSTVIDEAAGSFAVARINNRFGNNDVFKTANLSDPFTQAANTTNNGFEGLFPFERPFTMGDYNCAPGVTPATFPRDEEGNPWDWWNEAWFIGAFDAFNMGTPFSGAHANCRQLAVHPMMSPAMGRTYIDSVMGYLVPRINVALNLTTTSIENQLDEGSVSIFPNPMTDQLNIRLETADNFLQAVEIYNTTGQLVKSVSTGRTGSVVLDREGLTSGLYLLRVVSDQGSLSQRVLLK
ncbi:MAG: T9SS type A sorting domain-containing protein [Bacteroidota bacterium]